MRIKPGGEARCSFFENELFTPQAFIAKPRAHSTCSGVARFTVQHQFLSVLESFVPIKRGVARGTQGP